MAGSVEKLQKTKWFEAAVRKFKSYLEAHRRTDCLSQSVSFEQFASDILATPEHQRDDLLRLDLTAAEREAAGLSSAPGIRYRQYEPPKPDELNVGLSTRPKQKGEKSCGSTSRTAKRSQGRSAAGAGASSSSRRRKRASSRRSTRSSTKS